LLVVGIGSTGKALRLKPRLPRERKSARRAKGFVAVASEKRAISCLVTRSSPRRSVERFLTKRLINFAYAVKAEREEAMLRVLAAVRC